MDRKEWRDFCSMVKKQIADETEAATTYEGMENTLERSSDPELRAIGWSGFAQIKMDERKHRDILEHVKNGVCATLW